MIEMASENNNSQSDGSAEKESIADILSNPVRHQLVDHLRGTDGKGLRILAIQITRSEADRRGTSIPEIGHERMLREIKTEHIPLLEDAGVLTFNRSTEWIKLNGHDDEFFDQVLNED